MMRLLTTTERSQCAAEGLAFVTERPTVLRAVTTNLGTLSILSRLFDNIGHYRRALERLPTWRLIAHMLHCLEILNDNLLNSFS